MKDLVKKNPDLAILFIRLALGLGFMTHGVSKLQNIAGTKAFFDMQGIPAFMAYVVATIESVGGLAMILGVGTQFVAPLLVVIMAVAIGVVKLDKGWNIMNVELELAYLLASLAVLYAGPGKYAVKTGNADQPKSA